MAIDFAGTECEAFNRSAGTVIESTLANSFETGVVRSSIVVPASQWLDTPTLTSRTTAWYHFDVWFNSASISASGVFLTIYNSALTEVFRLIGTASATFKAQYWNGSAWVDIGSTYVITYGIRYTFDLNLVRGSSGSFALYVNGSGTPVLSGSADLSSITNFAKARFSGGTIYYSQVIVSDQSTIGHRYYSKPPTGNGANTSWTGAFGDVDETTLSTTDFIESTVSGDVETFTGAALSIPTGVVKAVVVSTQSKNAASGPQNIQGCIRKGGTNYFSSNISGIGISYTPILAIFENDPSTSSSWTLSDASAATLEFGVRSQA